jgi:hypothetical protein
MNAYTWLTVHDITCAVATIYLVMNDKPWWAGAFFVIGLLTSVKTSKPLP